tara:strand:- start:607 stop:780 length:174 start_codon:yes stop_codon:yes gene_type:complete
MNTYTAFYTYGYDRDDWRDWTFEAPNLDAALKKAYASNPYEDMGYWRIHRVRLTENQ